MRRQERQEYESSTKLRVPLLVSISRILEQKLITMRQQDLHTHDISQICDLRRFQTASKLPTRKRAPPFLLSWGAI